MPLHHAIVDERGEDVHQQDGEHHAFGIAFVEGADEDGEDADEESVNVFAYAGMRGGHGVGGHEDRTEHKAAHQNLVVCRDRTKACQPADHRRCITADEDRNHDSPVGHLREKQDGRTEQDGQFAGLADATRNSAHEKFPRGGHRLGVTVHHKGKRGGTGDRIGSVGNPHLVAGNHRRVGEEDKCSGQERRIQEVIAGPTEDLLAEKHGEDSGHGDNPQRHVGRHDHRDEEARDEKALRNLMFADLREDDLHEQSASVRDDDQRQPLQQSVKETFPKSCTFSSRQKMLITDIPPPEKQRRTQRDHHRNHDALHVNGIAHMAAAVRDGRGRAQERVDGVKQGVEFSGHDIIITYSGKDSIFGVRKFRV